MTNISCTAIDAPAGTSASAARTALPLTFARACAVELRKLINTRAAAALIAGGVTAMAAFGLGRATMPGNAMTLTRLVSTLTMPGSWLLLTLAALLVTGEFAHERAGQTFTLDPRRGRVIGAKATVVAAAGLTLALLSLAIGALSNLATPLLGGASLPWTLEPARLAVVAGSLVFAALTAFGWGLATRSAPATIAALLIWPTIATALTSASPDAARVLPWIEPNPLWAVLEGGTTAWAQLATSTLAWVIVPTGIGIWRLLRDDL